jgi:hypothetical protein
MSGTEISEYLDRDRICYVMVSLLSSSVENRGFDPGSSQTLIMFILYIYFLFSVFIILLKCYQATASELLVGTIQLLQRLQSHGDFYQPMKCVLQVCCFILEITGYKRLVPPSRQSHYVNCRRQDRSTDVNLGVCFLLFVNMTSQQPHWRIVQVNKSARTSVHQLPILLLRIRV